jgi:Chromate transporter
LARLFTKLGFVAFRGPTAHVAMMRQEVVERRHWMDDQEFLDLNSSLENWSSCLEMADHPGQSRDNRYKPVGYTPKTDRHRAGQAVNTPGHHE